MKGSQEVSARRWLPTDTARVAKRPLPVAIRALLRDVLAPIYACQHLTSRPAGAGLRGSRQANLQ
jgi:hypothetical protein